MQTRIATLAVAALAGATLAQTTTVFPGGDQAFLNLTNGGTLESAVLESRIGNANPEPGVWEVGLWRFGAVGSPLDQDGRGITNGETATFDIQYDGAGSLSMTIDGASVLSTNITDPFTDIFIRLRGGSDSTVALTALQMNGSDLDVTSISATNGVEYLRISNNGADFGAFQLTGSQQFSWTGNRPNNSGLAAQFKFTNVPAPGGVAAIALGGLAATRRRR
ncbi:MAG: choice-of-anchor W domain-containing protein [Planctomycetota bacterium]